jgi:hypothetical protein
LPHSSRLTHRLLAQGAVADATVCTALLLGCVKGCRLADAGSVTEYLASRGARVALKDYAGMLQVLPQRTRLPDALAFMDALEPCVSFRDAAGYSYFRHFSRLLVQEFLTEASAALERIASRSPDALAASGLALLGVRASELPKGGQLALTSCRPGMDLAGAAKDAFNKGDFVLLAPMSAPAYGAYPSAPQQSYGGAPYGAPPGPPPPPAVASGSGADAFAVEAEVMSVVPQFTVRVLGAGSGATSGGGALCGPGMVLRADKLANRITASRQLEALRVFADADAGSSRAAGVDATLRAIVCGDPGDAGAAVASLCAAPPDMPAHAGARRATVAGHAATLPGVNASQRAALGAGLSRTLTLVQGPPGTGKTATAVTLVKMWLAAGLGPVLATSDSNTAVDNLVSGLHRAGARVIRVGRPEAVRPDLLALTLEYASGATPLPGSAGAGAPPLPRDEVYRRQQETLRRAEVVCATCAGAGAEAFDRLSFPCVLLDECAQATEPSALVPLTRGARCVALVGDHKQLPPTVLSREADAAGLGVSLFDRLARCGVQPLLLDTQYRMHPALAHFPSATFYEGALRSGVRATHRPPPRGFPWPSPTVPLAFLPCDGAERADGTSHTNAAEADAVAGVVRALLAGGELSPSDIGIVTPYAAQVRLLRRALGPLRGAPLPGGAAPALEVASVDGFQGREKEVIVFSAVRASASGGVGFLADPRRLNVMLTRARRGLVVCGHWRTLSGERTFWGPWIEWAAAAGLICGMPARDAAAAAAVMALEACPRALAEAGDVAGVAAAFVATAPVIAQPKEREREKRRRSRSRSRSRERRHRSRERSRSRERRSRSRSRSRSRKRHHHRRSRSRSRSREHKHKHKSSHKDHKKAHRRSRSRSRSPRRRSRSRSRGAPALDANALPPAAAAYEDGECVAAAPAETSELRAAAVAPGSGIAA